MTKADINAPYTTNPLRQTNAKTDSETTFSGTTLHSARTLAPTSDKFLSLIDKHFPKDHSLRKIFNRNTIKISYSCMNNTKQVIDNHKKGILHSSYSSYTKENKNSKTKKTCNCREKNNFPLNGNCLQSSVAYQATVTRNDNNTSKT